MRISPHNMNWNFEGGSTQNDIYNKCSLAYDPNGDLPHTSIYKEIKKYDRNKARLSEEEWHDFNTFFRTSTTNKNSLLYIDYSDLIPSVDEVSKVIRQAGGMVFLAHVYSYGIKNHIQLIDHLASRQLLDGVEVYYSKFSDEQKSELHTYCRDHHLLMSGGSDTHGDKGRILNIGTGYGDLIVPDNIIEQWNR
ncbi:MAG TPA: hypothetical protein PKE04_07510 [Clostridia bacterium]|nr:hypothetical protein [Clostridia bacterium]